MAYVNVHGQSGPSSYQVHWEDGAIMGDIDGIKLIQRANQEWAGKRIGQEPFHASDANNHLSHWQGFASLCFLAFSKINSIDSDQLGHDDPEVII